MEHTPLAVELVGSSPVLNGHRSQLMGSAQHTTSPTTIPDPRNKQKIVHRDHTHLDTAFLPLCAYRTLVHRAR